ncbi:hypothetical protein ONZ51_g12323 [Trametes cubensis]|uniref:Uncharacterized protein n=1 Tax=Trametes cubensis TaxID=1111947 RepID=A0AAD7TIH2_9APHY|nr:hypothetical protein ONZ51_g12323 [Trametes cubensis]
MVHARLLATETRVLSTAGEDDSGFVPYQAFSTDLRVSKDTARFYVHPAWLALRTFQHAVPAPRVWHSASLSRRLTGREARAVHRTGFLLACLFLQNDQAFLSRCLIVAIRSSQRRAAVVYIDPCPACSDGHGDPYGRKQAASSSAATSAAAAAAVVGTSFCAAVLGHGSEDWLDSDDRTGRYLSNFCG